MRFLVDQPVSWLVAKSLCERGFDALHVADLGLSQALDEVIFAQAWEADRIIISQDTDFGTLLVASGNEKPSVILLRMRDGRPAAQAHALLESVSRFQSDLEAGCILVIEDASVRVRRMGGP